MVKVGLTSLYLVGTVSRSVEVNRAIVIGIISHVHMVYGPPSIRWL